MNENHQQIQEEIAAYCLGALDPAEMARIEVHLQQCEQCRSIAGEHAEVLAVLPFALPPTPPPPRTFLALQARMHDQHREQPRPEPARRRQWPARLQPLTRVLMTGLLIIVAAVGLAAAEPWQHASVTNPPGPVQQLRTRSDVRVVPLVGSTAVPSASGELLMTPDLQQAAIGVRGLPPLPSDRSYQIWFSQPDSTWVNGGVFRVSQQGSADVMVHLPRSLTTYYGCWVTEEPNGGSTVPTGPQVLAAAQR